MQEIKTYEEFEEMLYEYRCYLEDEFKKNNRAAFHPCEPLVYLYDMDKVNRDSEGDDILNQYDPDYAPIPESDFIHNSDIIIYSNDLENWYSDIEESKQEISRDVVSNNKRYYFADVTANYYIELNCSNVFQLMELLDRRVYGFVKNEYLNQCWQEVDIIGNLLFLQANMPDEQPKMKRGKSSVNPSMVGQAPPVQQVIPEYEIVKLSVEGMDFYNPDEYEPSLDNYDASAYEENVSFDISKIGMFLGNSNQISVFGKVVNLDVHTIKQIAPFAKILRKHSLKSAHDYINTVEELKNEKNFGNSLSTLAIPYNLMMHSCIAGFVEESYSLLPAEVGGFFRTVGLSDFIEGFISSDDTILPKFIKAQYDSIGRIYSNIAAAKENIENFAENGPMFVGGGFGIKGAVKGMLTAGALNLGMQGLNALFNTVSANIKNDKIAKDVEKLYKSEVYTYILYYLMYHDVYSFLFYYMRYINEIASSLRAWKPNDFDVPDISRNFNDSAAYYLHILSKMNNETIFINNSINDKPLLELAKEAIIKYPYEYEYYKLYCSLSGKIDYSVIRFAKIHGLDISNLAKEYLNKISK